MKNPLFIASAVVALATALFAGCASPPTKTIQIDSDPQGARVECNNEDLGKTPTTFTVRTNPEGEFLGAWAGSPTVQFTAYPPSGTTNLFIQRKTFSPNGFFRAGDHIPARMFFDLHQHSEYLNLTPTSR
ncbi:MAG: PEGA domain-containing protein [Verrucomicrobiota bacterium]